MKDCGAREFKDIVQYSLKAVLDLLIPRKCIVCEKSLGTTEKHLCRECLEDLPHTYYWLRKFNPMADRFNALIQEGLENQNAWQIPKEQLDTPMLSDGIDELEVLQSTWPAHGTTSQHYAYATALFFYRAESGYSQIPRQLKYHGDIPAGRLFGQMLGKKIASAEHFADVDAVIPVPLHWTRKWSRGYNQAEIIAREVAAELGAELRTDILKRSRRTRTQTKLSVEGKAANVQGAFSVCPGILDSFRITNSNHDLSPTTHNLPQPCSPKADISDLTGLKHLLIVDDVFTTGSTLYACYTALREVFPPSVRISVATLGFVGGT